MKTSTTIVTLIIASLVSGSLSFSTKSQCIYRTGNKQDELPIALALARELMNPLSIDGSNFLVAVSSSEQKKKKRIGWAQIRPLGYKTRDPNTFNAAPGSSRNSLDEDDVDDEMWREFEDDTTSIQVPIGWASLPWSKEYREFEEKLRDRQERREELLRRKQQQARSAGRLWELSSVYVDPDYRGQGIGADLVKRTLLNHAQSGRSISDVYLLTLRKTSNWYENNFGFAIIREDIPAQMSFEVAAGNVITGILGEELVCMRGSDSAFEEAALSQNSLVPKKVAPSS